MAKKSKRIKILKKKHEQREQNRTNGVQCSCEENKIEMR